MIEGVEVEVEVEAEEVAEDVGVGQKNYEEPSPRGSAADFLLFEEMEGDLLGREEVEAAAIKSNDFVWQCEFSSKFLFVTEEKSTS